jgi:hypothetical protein
MPTFNANEIIGKTLIAKKNLPIWKIPPSPSTGFAGVKWDGIQINKGKPAGVVYSYVGGNGIDPLFWAFETPGVNIGQIGSFFYVEHAEGIFDVKSLREQGVLTTQEIEEAEAEANKTGAEKLIDALKKGGKYILIVGSIYIAIKLYKEYKK